MERKIPASGRADAGNAPRRTDPKRAELTPADEHDLDAFQEVSRRSRRAVADIVDKLVRPA
jgi:hypothetical protein